MSLINDPLPNNFENAAKATIELLHKRLGFDLWMVTRTEGADWIVLQAEDHGYNVKAGSVFRWADSFCSQMVKGNGPHIAPNSDLVPAYANAPIGRQVPIKSYIGLPLSREDGSLFGTLCAVDPLPQPEAIVAEEELIELLAGMLSSILQYELKLIKQQRHTERLQEEIIHDTIPGIYNRRGWDQFMLVEEERCRCYGNPTAVIMIDIDELKKLNDDQGHNAGDALINRTAKALLNSTRGLDLIARWGGDEFCILAIDCDLQGTETMIKRIKKSLDNEQINASIGFAMRHPLTGLKGAWQLADQKMYEEKRFRKGVNFLSTHNVDP